ncbi:MAG: MFS transporter [Acidobacteriota bacterium]
MSQQMDVQGGGTGLAGMKGFTVVWLGQMVSLMGTGMTRFALIFWAFKTTGEATSLGLLTFFSFAPVVFLSPVAGALVDRWNRKTVMILSDVGAGIVSIALLILVSTGQLEIWHFYVAAALTGIFETFQIPAYGAAMTLMLPKEHYARASGMMSTAQSTAEIAAPIAAGVLLGPLGIAGILILDIATFLFAVGALFIVKIPQPEATETGAAASGSLWQESLFGFRYIGRHAGLLGLQLMFFVNNLIAALAFVLLPALVLARTDNDEVVLGSVQSALGVGALLGGLLLTVWGGPARKVHAVLLGWSLSMVAQAAIGLGTGVVTWAIAGALMMLFTPILNGSNQAIWQSKVPPDVQGRVFGVRRLIAQISWPLAALAGGVLGDRVFEPAMQTGGALAGTFGAWVGTGPGAGFALIFLLTGTLGAVVALAGYGIRQVRDVEALIPDHQAAPAAA